MKNASCSQNCVNTEGSFKCDCKDGYKLASDKKSCEGIKHSVQLDHLRNCFQIIAYFKTFNKTLISIWWGLKFQNIRFDNKLIVEQICLILMFRKI